MANYSDSKGPPGAIYPDNALESANASVEPIITPAQLRERHLFGLPLISQIKDPITNKAQQITDPVINDIIQGCIAQIETEFRIDVMPVKRRQKFPYDRFEYDAWGFFKLPHTPVSSIDKLTITPPNGEDLYELPKNWIETAYLIYGQVNIIPIGMGNITTGLLSSSPANGAWFLNVLNSMGANWIPAYWQFEYTSGYPNGQVPRVVNEMIGCLAAIEILGMLGTTYAKANSYSLGMDGMSQSVSTPGPNIFQVRIDSLREKYDKLGKRLRAFYNQKIFTDTV